jgi:hypothetical protein
VSVPILRNSAGQIVYICLFNGRNIVTTPTIAPGDIQISLDGGAYANPATLPSETPAVSGQVQIPLSQAETNGVHFSVRGIDQAGAEWDDFFYSIFTDTSTIGAIATAIAAIPAAVWSFATRTLTQAAASVIAAVSGSVVTQPRATTWNFSITGLGNITARTDLYFTIKRRTTDADTAAVVQIEETAGLIVINGGAPAAAGNGTLTVTDAVAGDVTVTLAAIESEKLRATDNLQYDFKMVTAAVVQLLTRNRFNISDVVTGAIT